VVQRAGPVPPGEDQRRRTGVAAGRSYREFKQCVVFESFEGGKFTGNQDALKEFSRTYKMNSMLRHNNPYAQARVTEVPNPSNFVYLGDSNSMDQTGPIEGQWENGQFSMEVNDKTQAGPALRHNKDGANILFVDGHAETMYLSTIKKQLRAPQNNIIVKSWESEFINSGSARGQQAQARGLGHGDGARGRVAAGPQHPVRCRVRVGVRRHALVGLVGSQRHRAGEERRHSAVV